MLILFQSSPSNRTVGTLESALRVERRLFHLRRNNYRPKKFACWPYLYLDTFEDIDEPYPVMIAETISSASFVLLVVVSCCVLKIYTMVKNIRPSRNERVRVVYARDNQRASPEREPTVYSTCSSTTYSGSQARRRQPQMHDERFGWQSKQKVSRVFQNNSKIIFFVLTAFNHSSWILPFFVFFDLMWYCVHHFHGSFRLEFISGNWRVLRTRNEFPSQAFFINCWLFNNYSPKWRWQVVNIYRAVKQRGKQMIITHYSYNEYTIFSGANRAWNAREWTAKVFEVWWANQSVPPTLSTTNWTFISFY